MKKTLLAAALATSFGFAAGAANAETSVTLYGIVDGGIGYQQLKGTYIDATGTPVDYNGKRTGMINGINSANRWGLKGTEDLGNGLQAVFVLESGFDLGTGVSGQSLGNSNRMFGRQATVGLQSDAWGRLDLGRQTNIASKYFAGIASPFGVDFGQAAAGATFNSAASLRYDNMVMYQTPSYSGFQFGIGYSFNANGPQGFRQSGGDDPNTHAWTTGLRYDNGPIGVAATYDQFESPDAFADGTPNPDGGVKVKSWNVGASYDFQVVKLHAGFGQTRNGWFQGITFADLDATGALMANDGMRVNSYTVGLSAPVGAGQVMASWGMADPRGTVGDDEKQNIYSLGYTYPLSKRTNVYAVGSYAKNVAFQDDLKSTLVGVGVRHQF
ncbi:MAG TPA: porin [Pusillimonas sp.]|uniref:porin n=1 Tax=Pusillimonas sp. TaxID=3040095 RepID=UPI002B4B1A2B|nr:porin [Pusillimonas sp.]HLU20795.1 porin [Pusillimonas sp.]